MDRRRIAAPLVLGAVVLMTTGCALAARHLPDVYGWVAVPTTPDPALLTEAVTVCRESVDFPSMLLGPPAVADQRGPGATLLLWSDGHDEAACLVLRDALGQPSVQRLTHGLDDGRPFALGEHHCGPPTIVTGSVEPDAAGVTIETRAGRTLTASVGQGRFIAWWPGRDAVARIDARAADGTSLRHIAGSVTCDMSDPNQSASIVP